MFFGTEPRQVGGITVFCRPIQCQFPYTFAGQVYIYREYWIKDDGYKKPSGPIFSVSIAFGRSYGQFWKLKDALKYAQSLQSEKQETQQHERS